MGEVGVVEEICLGLLGSGKRYQVRGRCELKIVSRLTNFAEVRFRERIWRWNPDNTLYFCAFYSSYLKSRRVCSSEADLYQN
jgi:hypothetical protein